ncbi:MAG: hypothetical protein K8H88_04525, partial [Sandaracinaceae bacterium]|nr:hypothetical protein [Sandaracinaceae bacterium]
LRAIAPPELLVSKSRALAGVSVVGRARLERGPEAARAPRAQGVAKPKTEGGEDLSLSVLAFRDRAARTLDELFERCVTGTAVESGR